MAAIARRLRKMSEKAAVERRLDTISQEPDDFVMNKSNVSYLSERGVALAAASAKCAMSKEAAREMLRREGLITKKGRLVELIKEQPKTKTA